MIHRLGLCAAGVLALLAFGSALSAQDATDIDGLVEKALKGMRLTAERAPDGYRFRLDNRPTTLKILDGGRLLLQIRFKVTPAPSLESLNRFNELFAVTTRAVSYAKEGIVLEAGTKIRPGTTAKDVADFINEFGKEVPQFEGFLTGKLAKTPGKKPPGEGPFDFNPSERPNPEDRPPSGGKPIPPFKSATIPVKFAPESDDKELEIHFPTSESAIGQPSETAWKIVWDVHSGEQANREGFKFGRGKSPLLFKIKQAFFRPGAKAPWIQVLEDAHPSEFYVPYFFSGTRFFDLKDHGSYTRLLAREGGPRSKLLGKDQYVMAELRDRGIVYKHGDISRRGEELVLWANFVAGNYTYLVEFCFHDDGTIAFKHAPTGYNYFDHFEKASHMHNCLWRIGVKLTSDDAISAANEVSLVKLPYDPKKLGSNGNLDIQPIESESFHDWDAKEFTRLRVTNPGVTLFPESGNRERKPISYDLVPFMQGQARHLRNGDEAFSKHDFWVTRSDCPEKMYIHLPKYFGGRENGKQLQGSDGVVLWHMSSALHVPRGEDGIYEGTGLKNGQALVNFTTVELRPRNLFTRTPLYKR
jgi:primary-amine oxidase